MMIPLSTLIQRLRVRETIGDVSVGITGVEYDSRKVQSGSLFVAMPGEKVHGREFIDQAVTRGCAAILSDASDTRPGVTTVVVENPRQSMADVAAEFHKNPSDKLKAVGITGTNGKTTVAFLVKQILDAQFLRAGLIGTVRYEIGDRVLDAPRTTPESADLQSMLAEMREAGCKAAVMEVSSHSTVLDRVRAIHFDIGVFTNLTQDHLDFHKTMEEYFRAKSRLFEDIANQHAKNGCAVINVDDTYGRRLADVMQKRMRVITYGCGASCDVRASHQRIDFNGTHYQLDAEGRSFLVRMPLIGRFNVYNSLAALASASGLGLNLREAIKTLETATAAPGRLESVPSKRAFRVYVDYAHTPDALLNVLRTLRELEPSRLITVFGCGGNRDTAKRAAMGRIAAEHADYTIITSDNPRREEPTAIIGMIEEGMKGAPYEVIVDRREAIFRAITIAEPHDIILIAGKGHETYQEFADHTLPFDDLQVARWALEACSTPRPETRN
jgi:UDP-N-acetylmuramoyl-L-alanyl-D-glutamate--2,6-diaminopimelate ligase